LEEGEVERFRAWLRDWETGATQDIEVPEYEEEEITEALEHIDEAQDRIN
jgi:hypothetical protein